MLTNLDRYKKDLDALGHHHDRACPILAFFARVGTTDLDTLGFAR